MTRTRSPAERRAMFARMGKDYHAMNRDMSVRAANTLPDTPENRKEWVKDSRRIDIEGIDTPIIRKLPEKTTDEQLNVPYAIGDVIVLESGADGKIINITKDNITFQQSVRVGDGLKYETHTVSLKDKKMVHRKDFSGKTTEKWDLKTYYGEPPIKKINSSLKGAPSAPTGFKADANLINKTTAMRAHQGTSWKPDERGKMEIEGFEKEVNSIYEALSSTAKSPEQKSILKREIDVFQRLYANKENQRLAKHGSLYSTMIAGGSNFNSKQANKRSDSYEKTARENREWKSKAINKIRKKIKQQGIYDEGGEIQVIRNKLKRSEDKHAAMKTINRIVRNKKLSDSEKINKIVKETGFKESTAKTALGVKGFESWELTNNNANIKRMRERIKTMEDMDEKKTTSKVINGVEIIDSSEEDRVQIFFDGKPDEAMRSKLKGSGWRWSPTNTAWQRKRTDNAMRSAEQILKGD